MSFQRTIGTFILAFLVFFSGSSFVVGIHRCQGEVREWALFSKAEACDKQKSLPPCHRKMTSACCEDEEVFHEGQGFEYSTHHASITQGPEVIIDHGGVCILSVVQDNADRSFDDDYDPPLRACDLTVVLRVFLI